MSNNELAMSPEDELEVLAEIFDQDEQGGDEYSVQPTRIKLAPGGAPMYLMGESQQPVKEFVGVPILAQRRKQFWPSKTSLGKPPLCVAFDAKNGVFNYDDMEQVSAAEGLRVKHLALAFQGDENAPSSFDCATCPMMGWKSAPSGGRGRACKETYSVMIWMPDQKVPCILNIPPTSLKIWDTFCNGIPIAFPKFAFWGVRAKFTVAKKEKDGTPYGVVNIEPVAPLPLDVVLRVSEMRKEYKEWLRGRNVVVDVDDAEAF